MTNDDLQESPICQLWMMFTEAISFRKVRLILNYPFSFFWKPLIIWCNGAKGSTMVANAW